MGEKTFCQRMRAATKEIHAISDALVNAKLAFALSDSSVWANGLLIFYEIFLYLEEAMDRLRGTPVAELDVDGMRRTDAFEKDLNFYLGENWKNGYTPRPEVAKYLLYLKELESREPIMLTAYIYHLYMGLMSGGQILMAKRNFYKKVFPFTSAEIDGGNAVTEFDVPISKIKSSLVKAMNSLATELDERTQDKLIEESKCVFLKNNEIIKTVEGTTRVIVRKAFVVIAICFVILLLILFVI